MTKLRNAVLAGVLTLGIGGAGVLAAAPAYAAPVATLTGSLTSATGTAGQDLDFATTNPVWTLSEPVTNLIVAFNVPEGTEFRNSFNGVPGTERQPGNPAAGWKFGSSAGNNVYYSIFPLSSAEGTWQLQIISQGGLTDVTMPTLKIGETTPGALQETITLDLLNTTDEAQPSATFTWTEDQPDTPVIAPVIGGAAAVAGLGISGIVLLRRRNAEQA